MRVDAGELRETTARILHHAGLPEQDSRLAADVLVMADLRGVSSHGVSNMLRTYLSWLESGHAAALPSVRIIRETASAANLDGDRGLGVVVAPRAMGIAIDKARQTGVGIVTVSNSRHLGMASYHAMLALTHEMIGVVATSTGPRVLPTFGREPRLGTNPIAVAAPSRLRPPFVYDGATSAITSNKIKNFYRDGAPIPPMTVADANGNPIPTVTEAPALSGDVYLLPLGSTREAGSHKGYGLGAAVEILATVLSGSALMMQLGKYHSCHFLMALDVAAFTDPKEFEATVDRLSELLTSTPPAAGHDRVLVAGLEESETQSKREREGIPIHAEVLNWFDEACSAIGVEALHRRPEEVDLDG